MKNIFSADDFTSVMYADNYLPEHVAKLANKKLTKLIESWPVVYFQKINEAMSDFRGSTDKISSSTHSARLAFIEEIKCSHKNSSIWEPHLAGARKCNDCGYEYNPNISKEWFPEPCKHEPISRMMVEDMNYRNEFGLIGITILDPSSSNCAKCGSKIMARWEEKK